MDQGRYCRGLGEDVSSLAFEKEIRARERAVSGEIGEATVELEPSERGRTDQQLSFKEVKIKQRGYDLPPFECAISH